MSAERALVRARGHARLVVVDGISHQQFSLRIDKLRMCHGKIKKWVVALESVLDRVNLLQGRKRASRPPARPHENLFALITANTEC